jgi:ribonuclease HIII
MQPEIIEHLEKILPLLEKSGFILREEKPVNYGVQLKLESGNNQIPLTLYFSAKKGISTVIGGSPTNPLKRRLAHLLNQSVALEPPDHQWQSWIGSDESGKGDFFGPLVTAGFCGERKILPYLKQIGVKDSKNLNDTEIENIGKRLYAVYFDQIKVVTLLPETYNLRYSELKQNGKNLNDLLAWMHARIIIDLHDKYKPEGVMIDKFTSDGRIRAALKGMKEISFIAKTKGESDLFVAAASIIARFHFNRWFKRVSAELDFYLPRGAGNNVDKAAQELVNITGRQNLSKYAKIHFTNYKKIK